MEPIFISYRSTHKEEAFQICKFLEDYGHQCKIAPRDIPLGENYPGWIMQTIMQCRALVLVASEDIDTSENILSEIRQAFDNNVTIISFYMENATPDSISLNFQYYLKLKQGITDYGDFADGLHQLLRKLDVVPGWPEETDPLDTIIPEKGSKKEGEKSKIGFVVFFVSIFFLVIVIGIWIYIFPRDGPGEKSNEENVSIRMIHFWEDEITLAPGESRSLETVMDIWPDHADPTDIDYGSTNRAVAYVKPQEPGEVYRSIVVPANWKEENGLYADITAGIGTVASINSKGEPGGVRVTVQSTLPSSGKSKNQPSDGSG